MMTRPSARHAYVNAEIATALAKQIRNLRIARGWTQRELARRLGTTQNAVSRLEDPSYGRTSLQTLLQLSQVFDTGLQVRFISMVQMLRDTWQPREGADLVPTFEEEAPSVAFVANGRHAHIINDSATSTTQVALPYGTPSFVRAQTRSSAAPGLVIPTAQPQPQPNQQAATACV